MFLTNGQLFRESTSLFTCVHLSYIIIGRASRAVSLLVAEKHWQHLIFIWKSILRDTTSLTCLLIAFRSVQSKVASSSSTGHYLSSSAMFTIWKELTCSVPCSSICKAQSAWTSPQVSKHVNSKRSLLSHCHIPRVISLSLPSVTFVWHSWYVNCSFWHQ